MAFKLSKAEIDDKGRKAAELKAEWDEVVAAEDAVNEAVDRYNEAVQSYNTMLGEVIAWKDDIVSQIDSDYSEKSEKWQEGDTGQAVDAWKSEWENIDFSEIDHLEVTFAEDPGHADEIDALPEAPE